PYFIEPTLELQVLSQFGVLMLMLLSGLMTDYKTFLVNRRASVFIGALGVAVTFLLIYLPLHFIIGPLYNLSTLANLFIAAILSNTAIEISASILLHSRRPKLKAVIIGASFVDDIIAVFLIGIVSSMIYSGETLTMESIFVLSIEIILFLAISLLVATYVIEHIFDKLIGGKSKITLTVTLIVAFLFAIIANLIGLHEVIGAYIAGLIIGKWGEHVGPMLKRRIAWEKLKTDIDTPLRAIFGPLFFGFIGLSLVFPALDELPKVIPLIIILTILAIVGKILGCGVGAKIFDFSNRESLTLGCAMCGRGALELVLVSFGLEAGLIDESIFTALVMVTVITVIVTPILYTLAERRIKT
ncbi:MAG: cation:proton antiporter, partial [Thermoplasmata archaeon]|nr:cation:proton antiporter [Thermoplasmata archaeon]